MVIIHSMTSNVLCDAHKMQYNAFGCYIFLRDFRAEGAKTLCGWCVNSNLAIYVGALQIVLMADVNFSIQIQIVSLHKHFRMEIFMKEIMSDYVKIKWMSCFNSGTIVQEKLWFISINGYLMSLDLNTSALNFAYIKNIEEWNIFPVIDEMFIWDTSVIWIDQYGKYVHEYNIKEKTYSFYQLPEVEMIDFACFAGIYKKGHTLFFFPKLVSSRIEFNLLEKKYIVVEKLRVRGTALKELEIVCTARKKNLVYLFVKNRAEAIVFNMDNSQYEYILLPTELFAVQYAIYKNSIFYILSGEGNVYVWNEEQKIVELVYFHQNEDLSFSRIFVTDNKLFMLPALSTAILIVDLHDRYVAEFDEYPVDFEYYDIEWGKYLGTIETEDYAWFSKRMANYMLRIDKNRECIEWIKIQEPIFEDIWNVYSQKGRLICFESEINLSFLFREQFYKRKNENGQCVVGKSIWDEVIVEDKKS